MNQKKLAEALNNAARFERGRNGETGLAVALYAAAAACEEEGEQGWREATTEHNVEEICISDLPKLYERIAALEATLGRRDTVLGSAVARIAALEAKVAALDEWSDHFGLAERLTAPPPALTEHEADAKLGAWGSGIPPAPEERCAKPGCGQDRRNWRHNAGPYSDEESHAFVPPAAASAAPSGREECPTCHSPLPDFRMGVPQEGGVRTCADAFHPPPEQAQEACYCTTAINRHEHPRGSPGCTAPPEQAQETGEEMARRVTKKAIHDALAPEQARRTVTGGKPIKVIQHGDSLVYVDSEHGKKLQAEARGLECTVVELRPGERIVSGEGVRVHLTGGTAWRVCDPELWPPDGKGGFACLQRHHATLIDMTPDAPPRAEGE